MIPCEAMEEDYTVDLPLSEIAPPRMTLVVPSAMLRVLSEKKEEKVEVMEEEEEVTVVIEARPSEKKKSQLYLFLFDPYYPPVLSLFAKKFFHELKLFLFEPYYPPPIPRAYGYLKKEGLRRWCHIREHSELYQFLFDPYYPPPLPRLWKRFAQKFYRFLSDPYYPPPIH